MDEMARRTAEVGYHLPGGLLIELANATQVIALADMTVFKAQRQQRLSMERKAQ
jgi:hypothetical protein